MTNKLNLGIPRRADGLPRNWILSDAEYLTVPAAVVAALADYEVLRNSIIARRITEALRADYEASSRFFTWDQWRLSRESAYEVREQWRLPRLPREAINVCAR